MQCFPFYTLVKAEGSPTVNLAVLDIEGYELAVLRKARALPLFFVALFLNFSIKLRCSFKEKCLIGTTI